MSIDRTITAQDLQESFQRAYSSREVKADHWFAIAGMLAQEAKFQAAEVAFNRALSLEPNRPDIRADFADCLRRQWKFDEAHAQITQALYHDHSDRTRYIAGCLFLELGESQLALEYLTPEICTPPWARLVRSHALLHDQQWKEGFEWQEARLEIALPALTKVPLWRGEDLTGKTLAITKEQGYGDTICYSRFIRDVARLYPAGTVIFGLPSNLRRLMSEGLDYRPAQISHLNDRMPPVDYWLPIMSLPYALGITEICPPEPYICPVGDFDVPKPPGTRLKVGIVWRSKAGLGELKKEVVIHGLQKSIPLEELLPLAAIPGVTLYSLQMGGTEEIRNLGAETLIVDLASRAQSFNDDALFMKEMDVIISVDTATLHLAGAMGKDTLALLAVRGQWPFPNGDKTPWYGTMKCLRQPKPFDWTSVVELAADELRARL